MTEKRHHKRHAIQALVRGHDKALAVFDLSKSGVRLVGDFKPVSNEILFCLKVGDLSAECRGTIAWCKAFGPAGVYQVGVSFIGDEGDTLINELDAMGNRELVARDQGALLNLSDLELSRLELLARISAILNESNDIDDLLSRVMDIAMQTMNAQRALLLMDREGEFRPSIVKGINGSTFSQRVVTQVLTNGVPLVSVDASEDTRLSDSSSIEMLGTRSVLCVPIRKGSRILGLLYLDNCLLTGVFMKPELNLLSILADMAAGALERVEVLGFLSESRQQLAAARDDLHSLVERNPDGIMVVDQGGIIAFCNQAAESFLGSELLGQKASFSISPGEQKEMPIVSADGTPGFGQVRAESTKWDQNPASLVTIRDITALREKEEQLRNSQKMQAVGQLAGGIAHDFNNLMMAVLGHCDMMDLGDDDPENLAQIRTAANRAAVLTDKLLTFSRRRACNPSNVDLNELVSGLTGNLESVTGEGIQVSLHLSKSPLVIYADKDELGQALMSLVVNAQEAMPAGGELQIETGSEVSPEGSSVALPLGPGEHAFIKVRDTGNGVEEAVRRRMFEPFFSTKPQGTGLGLSTVYGIVQASKGGISVHNRSTGGAQFAVYFPLAVTPKSASNSKSTPKVATDVKRFLVVEDEPGVRQVVVKVLKKSGYIVTAVESAEDALELGTQLGHFDFLLSDVMLPGKNGLDLARELTAQYKHLRVLLISGYSEDILKTQSGTDETFPFMHKPFTLTSLSERVREILDEEQ